MALLVVHQRSVECVKPIDFEEGFDIFVPPGPVGAFGPALAQGVLRGGSRPAPGRVGIEPQHQIRPVLRALFKGQIGFVADRNSGAGNRFALMMADRFDQFVPAADFDGGQAGFAA